MDGDINFKTIVFNYYTGIILMIVGLAGLLTSTTLVGFLLSIIGGVLGMVIIITTKSMKKNESKNNNDGGKVKVSENINVKIWRKVTKDDNFIVMEYKRGLFGLKKIKHDEVLKLCSLMRSHDYVLRAPLEDTKGTFFYFERMRAEDLVDEPQQPRGY